MTRPTDPYVDPYKVLQVDPEADPDVIQAAYRRLAQKYHPDVAGVGEGAARMVALNAAWEVLSDPSRRATIDRERAAHPVPAGGPRPAPGSAPSTTGAAGPPPGHPAGSVLTFGRYAAWSLGEIARVDADYLEWLDRMPIGRPYREELDALLRRAGRRRAPATEASERRGLFRRR